MSRTIPLLAALAAMLLAIAIAVVAALEPAQAAFPGKNGKIVFWSTRTTPDSTNPEGDIEVFTMSPDGSRIEQLTRNSANDAHANYSSDGKQIAFQSTRDGNGEIYKMDADGSNQTRLTNNRAWDAAPSYSLDGEQIAFHSLRDGNYEIYKMNSDGTGQTNLTNTRASEIYPAYSPDGKQIVFVTNRDGSYQIYSMNADGSNQTRLTDRGTGGESHPPSFSPDGELIAFEAIRNGNEDIYVMNADGSNETRLTNAEGWDGLPSFSPDGKQITFFSSRNGNEEVYVMNADGSNQIRLTNNPAVDRATDWQPLPSAYPFSGFFPPVDNPPTMNVVKAGGAVPLKFSLGGDEGLDVFAQGYPISRRISCASAASLDDIERTLSAGQSALSYDAELDRYTYVWKSKKVWSGTCRQLVMKLDDGSVHRANFKFK